MSMTAAEMKLEVPKPAPLPVISVAVRELVEFVLRCGDLAGRGDLVRRGARWRGHGGISGCSGRGRPGMRRRC